MQAGSRGRDLLPAAAVVALAVGLRVAWVLLVPSKPVGDFAMYLESAVHLAHHGALDPEFVYMPGYVALAAALLSLGGGVLAVKLAGALLAGAAAGAVYGIGAALADRRAGLLAGLGYALWPAGIAVTSVTGTDMPAAALLALAIWALVRLQLSGRGLVAAAAFGALMGLSAYVRAVTVPLAAFGLFFFRAGPPGVPWRRAFTLAALSAVVALLVLAPWGLRNHSRYGEWFITDSHGGLTALVGANPNSDGRYSRSLNRMFRDLTGYTLLAEPHRRADRAAYQLARQLTGFSPGYAAGLVVEKTRRLLGQERALLYWPMYRAGVLRPGPVESFFDRHRPGIERLVDGFWLLLVAAAAAGVGLAVQQRRWGLLALLPVMLGLVGVYALYFAEVRYQLPIATLMFPLAGFALATVSRGLDRRALLALLVPLLVVGAGWPGLLWAGQRLRDRHRFAAQVCQVAGHNRLCMWRASGAGDSPVRGVYDGVGLRLGGDSGAVLEVPGPLPPGPLLISAQVDLAPAPAPAERSTLRGQARLLGNGQTLVQAPLADLYQASAQGQPLAWQTKVAPGGGPLRLELRVEGAAAAGGSGPAPALWFTSLSVRTPP